MSRPPEAQTSSSFEMSKAAFQLAQAKGHFKFLKPGTLVAYADGQLFATAQSWEELMEVRHRQQLTGELFVESIK